VALIVFGAVGCFAYIAGYVAAKSWFRLSAVLFAGYGVLAALLAALWNRGYGGDGSYDQVLVFGHWIDQQLSDLIFLSAVVWPFGLLLGAGLRLAVKLDNDEATARSRRDSRSPQNTI
jgi:hypothetical protein